MYDTRVCRPKPSLELPLNTKKNGEGKPSYEILGNNCVSLLRIGIDYRIILYIIRYCNCMILS